MEGKPAPTPFDVMAIGLAVMSCTTVENFLRRAWVTEPVFNGSLDRSQLEQKRFQKGFGKSLRELAKWLSHHPKVQALPEKDRTEITSYLDALVEWRDALCHGSYSKEQNGNIHLQFYDYQSWDPAGIPGSNIGPKRKSFPAQELIDLARTNGEALEHFRKLLDIPETATVEAPVTDIGSEL